MEQKDSRFQIEMTLTKELIKEGHLAIFYRTWNGVMDIGLVVLGLGLAAFAAFCAWNTERAGWDGAWEHYLPYIVFFLLLDGIIIGMLIASPGLLARSSMKRLTILHGDTFALKITYFFADDAIHSQSSTGQKIDTAYEKILSVHETAHGIVLRRKMSLFDILDKSRIEGGTLEDFKAFLQEKMPNAKFHWKHK